MLLKISSKFHLTHSYAIYFHNLSLKLYVMRNYDEFKSYKNYISNNIFQVFMQTEIDKVERELKIKNYSSKTIKSYLYGLREYFSFKGGDFTKLDQENIRNFLLQCEKRHISPQSRNLFLNAIKFYYRHVLKNTQKTKSNLLKNQRACLLFYREAK